MWIGSSIQVGECPVRLSVEKLDERACDRTAAVLAWLTLEQLMSEQAALAWNGFVADVVRDHVLLWIPGEQDCDQLGPEWWNEAMGLAFLQFVRDNELSPRVNRHLETLRTVGGQA